MQNISEISREAKNWSTVEQLAPVYWRDQKLKAFIENNTKDLVKSIGEAKNEKVFLTKLQEYLLLQQIWRSKTRGEKKKRLG